MGYCVMRTYSSAMLEPTADAAAVRGRLSTLLREIRASKSLTQAEVAERLNQPQSFVSKYESGERRLEFTEVSDVCKALGVSFSEFAADFEST